MKHLYLLYFLLNTEYCSQGAIYIHKYIPVQYPVILYCPACLVSWLRLSSVSDWLVDCTSARHTEFVQLLRIFFCCAYRPRRDLRAIAFSLGAKPIRQTSRLLFCIADDLRGAPPPTAASCRRCSCRCSSSQSSRYYTSPALASSATTRRITMEPRLKSATL